MSNFLTTFMRAHAKFRAKQSCLRHFWNVATFLKDFSEAIPFLLPQTNNLFMRTVSPRTNSLYRQVAVVAFSSLARILGECSAIHFSPVCFFVFFLFCFCFEVEISSPELIPLFLVSGSVHSGSASWNDYGRTFLDKLRLNSFLDIGSHTMPEAA